MNIIKSIFQLKCPKCRGSKIFIEPFELAKPLAMPKTCSVCNQKFEPEPGFYFGAMFLSYIISGWVLLGIALILVFYFKMSVTGAMLIVLLVSALFYIKLLRLSRSIWIHLMVKYDPKAVSVSPAEETV